MSSPRPVRAVRPSSRRALIGVLLSALLGGLLVVMGVGSAAAVSPTPWSGSGPGEVQVQDGSVSDPQLTYDFPSPGYESQTWEFVTTATTSGDVTVPYTYSGYHGPADFQATLVGFVETAGSPIYPLVDVGFQDLTGPFSFSGAVTFSVAPGETYGFRITGTSGDSNEGADNVLSGELTLPFSPYNDEELISQNTSWPNALDLPAGPEGVTGDLVRAGESRWFKFPVIPDTQVQVDLEGHDQNFDLTLFRDIGQAFTAITSPEDLPRLGAEFAADAYSPSIYSPSIYSPSIYSPSIYSPSIYSPSIYSPSIYSPSIYSPSIYSPSIYSPSIYSPSIYSPSIYSPSIYSPDQVFIDAFSSAQTRSLIAVSAQEGVAPESIRASTWNNTGSFYVRVNGRSGAFSGTPFTLRLTTSGGPCVGVDLDPLVGLPTVPTTEGASAVILTDTARLGLTGEAATGFLADLGSLAASTNGVVVDLAGSERVRALNEQADANPSCYYAKNVLAEGIRDVVESHRAAGPVEYVVLAGGDDVIPFFRYPDTAGLGAEQDYVPPVAEDTPSQASLRSNTVLGQDAYGSTLDLAVKGAVLPVPDLAVGRLVETPAEISAQVDDFLSLPGGTLPAPDTSLVTGYDFLTSAADAVQEDFSAGMVDGRADTLITDQGVPTDLTTEDGVPTRDRSWTADDLRTALGSDHHDLLFLAGHFSANSTLAADYATSVLTTELAADPGLFTGSLVLSPGCHSGYNLLDAEGIPGLTEGLDWAQLMGQQRATLIAGTGYQYADTDFLAYSADLYTRVTDALRVGSPGTPVAVGQALVTAKQAYLADVVTLTGIDQKSIIEAALFGLPMTGLDLDGRTGVVEPADPIPTVAAPTGTPGAVLGLRTAVVEPALATTVNTRPVLDLDGDPTGQTYRWLTGPDGVHTAPAVPARPKAVLDITPDLGTVRGVGFRSGTYTDTPGVTPLTGAPATEQNGIHTSFDSPAFFPQQLFSINYFGELAGSSDGRTRLIVTPAQHRADGDETTTERRFSDLGLTVYTSDSFEQYGANTPALAAPPAISQVTSEVVDGRVEVSARLSGDPSAGLQEAWVTYTAEAGPLHGSWASVDLTQDPTDSTLWTGAIAIVEGQSAADVRFMLQAVNGVGLVGVDNNFGVGYTPGVPVGQIPEDAVATSLTLAPLPPSAEYGDQLLVTATLANAPAGSAVTFGLGAGTVVAYTDDAGMASAELTLREQVGTYTVTAAYAGDATHRPSAAAAPGFELTRAATAVAVTGPRVPIPVTGPASGYVTLTSGGDPLRQKSVRMTVTDLAGNEILVYSRLTDLNGRASIVMPPVTLPAGRLVFRAEFGVDKPGTAVDPSYAASGQQRRFRVSGLPVLTLPDEVIVSTRREDGRKVTYTATAVDGLGRRVPVACAPPSGSFFPVGTTTVSCTATNRAGEQTTDTFPVSVVRVP